MSPTFWSQLNGFVVANKDEIEAASAFFGAFFTIVLSVSTILLWLVTRKLAVNSERALTELERPQVFVEIVESGIKADSSGLMSTATGKQFEYRFVNYGRTAAQLIELRTAFPIEASPAMAYPVDPSQGGRKVPVGAVSGPDKPYRETENLMAVCDVSRLIAPDAWQKDRLYFIGWVRYSDIFHNIYITGFCSVFDPLGNRFVLIGDERYNYTRNER
jgi:hypothetical protein